MVLMIKRVKLFTVAAVVVDIPVMGNESTLSLAVAATLRDAV